MRLEVAQNRPGTPDTANPVQTSVPQCGRLRSNGDDTVIPSIPSATVSPDSSARHLLGLGAPFVEFPKYSILELLDQKDGIGND